MLISYVLRLRPDALAKGRFVGEIEAVTTRERSSVRTIDQLADFILGTSAKQVRRAHRRQHAPGACGRSDCWAADDLGSTGGPET